MRIFLTSAVAIAGASMLTAGASAAGGYVAPVATPPIVGPVVAVEPASSWAGAYGGVALGYSFGGDDEVGLDFFDGGVLDSRATGLADLDIGGVTGSLHGGYRWQRGSWVYGPELSLEGGSVDDSADFSEGGVSGTISNSVNYIAALTLKTGYLVNPQTMVYGTAGWNYGDFTYELEGPSGSGSDDYTANGYVLGLGVERQVSERMSVFAEYQYRDFGSTDATFADGADSVVTVATPKHQNVKLGVNFRF
ncbi:outer membrane protein [Paracoccus spongiarum]|uniref:Outer membrane beta-barrel protein n=1 Tax=Paracoccus spongiarum TaxID=3064387 RepID=A0ABT9J9P1_9RHOB|nr:outer membrane beta-barrel protein [Paracoccus sp. 2205BS29-5]MDP5306532.1 outer membrane beta-barrel protein [Paracoccus sp. 2205BS29-5]